MSRSFFCVCVFVAVLSLGVASLPARSQSQQSAPISPQTPEQQELARIAHESRDAFTKGDYPAAIKSLQAGLEKAQAMKSDRGTEQYIAGTLNNLGSIYGMLGQTDKALDYLNRASALLEKLGNPQNFAVTVSNIGRIYEKLGQFDRAIDYYNRAVSIQEKSGAPQDLARTLNNLGEAHYGLGQFDQAMDYHNRALALREKLGNPHDIADTLAGMGNVYDSLGQYEKALDCDSRVLEIREKLGNQQDIATILDNLGNIYYGLGQFNKALDYHNRALALREKLGNSYEIAYSLDNLGSVYDRLGQYEKSLEYRKRALALHEKLNNPQDLAKSLNNVGNSYLGLERFQDALDYYKRSLTLKEKQGNLQEIAYVLASLGNAYASLGQFETALDYHNRALTIFEKLGASQDTALCFNNLGLTYDRMRRPEDALRNYQRAIALYESAGQQVQAPSRLGQFQQANQKTLYALCASALLQVSRPQPEQALLVADRGRAQGLARQLDENRSEIEGRLKPDDARRLRLLRSDLIASSNALRAVEFLPQGSEAAAREKQKRLQTTRTRFADAENRLDGFRAELFRRYPDYARIAGAHYLSPEELSRLTRDNPDALFLEYATVDKDNMLLFALAQGKGLKVFRLPIGLERLIQIVADWRRTLAPDEARRRPIGEKSLTEAQAARELYRLALAPVEKAGLLRNVHRLVIVADGPLLDIPFAALLDARGGRLIERFSVSCAFSLGMLTWPEEPRKPTGSLFCAADPQGEAVVVNRLRGALNRLPFARKEAQSLLSLFPDGEGLFGAAAKKSVVLREMARFRLLHFATHGFADGMNGMRSCLLCASDIEGENGGAFLEAQEIMGLRLSARLAVLSACQTAEGEKSGGEGLQGLAWAFRAAGCPAIVASQWSADDVATGTLMLRFYQQLKAGKRKDDALRDAMLFVRKSYPAPRFWAAFEVIGEAGALRGGAQTAP